MFDLGLDNTKIQMYNLYAKLDTTLIKRGRGNGPVKPGNLRMQGAKSGGYTER